MVRRNFIVTGLAGDAELESLDFQILHEGLHSLWNCSEVVVIHLLVLGRVVPHQCPASEHQVGACIVERLVDKEILLLPS